MADNQNQDNRICQFAIPLAFMEVPNLIAAAMFGMVVLRASPGSLRRGEPPAYTHYHAWHQRFPRTAFNILNDKGERPEPPWVELQIGEIERLPNGDGRAPILWKHLKGPVLWTASVTLDGETLLAMPGVKGVAGNG